MPDVSVIIPNYNNTRYVGDAVRSVLNQSYSSYEIIVVDDGSTDHCYDEILKFTGNIHYIWQENKGLGGARNTGILAAKGEYIGLLDADDEWLPDFLQKMVSQISKFPNAAVAYCYAQGMDDSKQDLPQQFGGPAISPYKMYARLLRANFLIPSTILMRRSIIIESGLFDQENRQIHGCEDWDLWLRILRNKPEQIFIGLPECLARYRLHNHSLSVNVEKMRRAYLAVIEKHFGVNDHQPDKWSDEKKRGYGGVFRYFTIMAIQRSKDWQAGLEFLNQAIQTDPTLALDLDFFYDLALGSQPVGFRGTKNKTDLFDNSSHLNRWLMGLSKSREMNKNELRKVKGTANFGIGLVAYNTGERSFSRPFFLKALYFRPDLWKDKRIIGNFVKSFINHNR